MSGDTRYPFIKSSDFKFSRRIGDTTFCRAVGLPVPAGCWMGFQGVDERVYCFRDRDGLACFAWSAYGEDDLASLLHWIAPVATRMSFERYTGTIELPRDRQQSECARLGGPERGPSIHRTYVVVGRCVTKLVCDDPTKHLPPDIMHRIAEYAGFDPCEIFVHPDTVNDRRLVSRAWSRFPVITRERCVEHVYSSLHPPPVDFDVRRRGFVKYPRAGHWTGPWVFGCGERKVFWERTALPFALKDRLLHPVSPHDWDEIRRFHRWLLRSWRELMKNRERIREDTEVSWVEKRQRDEEIVRDFDRKRARVNAFVQ